MNAFAEHWVQTLGHKCLGHLHILGARHLSHLVREVAAHYNQKRPHQSRGNVPPADAAADDAGPEVPSGEVKSRERHGGLLKHHFRAAAAA